MNIDFDKYDCDVVEYISGFVVKSVGIHLSSNICFKFALKHASDKHTKNNWINFKEKYCLNHPQKEIVDICKYAEAELKTSLNFENCMKKLFFFQKMTQKVVNQFAVRCPNFLIKCILSLGMTQNTVIIF